MRTIGYTRVSTEEQGRSGLGLAAQRAAILEARPEAEVVEEVASGGRADNRPVLQEVLDSLRRGDTLVVAKLDRLARSVADAADLIRRAERQGWNLVVLDLGLDLSTPMGCAMAQVASVFAELERKMIGLRIKEALAAKRAAGWDPTSVPQWRRQAIVAAQRQGLSHRAIARELRENRRTVARILQAA